MKISFRSGSVDSSIFEAIFTFDEYKLPASFSADDIIIDVGAHVGFFTLAVVLRGAGKVLAFEADAENCTIARGHLREYLAQGTVDVTWGAVWRSDRHENILHHSGYPLVSNILNTGAGSFFWPQPGNNGGIDVLWPAQTNGVPVIPFDRIILQATDNGRRHIRLLKLDCEASEWPILLTAQTLHLIDEIYGEFHEIGGPYDTYVSPISIAGYDRFVVEHLTTLLQNAGFAVSYQRHRKHNNTLSHNGAFFATRIFSPAISTNSRASNISPGQAPVDEKKPPEGQIRLTAGSTTLARYPGWVRCAAFSADTQTILLASSGQTVQLWDVTRKEVRLDLQPHAATVTCVCLSSDDASVLTGTADGTLYLWDARSGSLLTTLCGHTNWISSISISPTGKQALTGACDGLACLWDLPNRRKLAIWQSGASWVASAAFSPDGSKVALGLYDGTAQLWELESRRLLHTWRCHSDMVTVITFSPDGNSVLTASPDCTAVLWETLTGHLLLALDKHTSGVRTALFSSDGGTLMTGTADGVCYLWTLDQGRLLTTFTEHTTWIVKGAFSPDTRRLLTISYDGCLLTQQIANQQALENPADGEHHGHH